MCHSRALVGSPRALGGLNVFLESLSPLKHLACSHSPPFHLEPAHAPLGSQQVPL